MENFMNRISRYLMFLFMLLLLISCSSNNGDNQEDVSKTQNSNEQDSNLEAQDDDEPVSNVDIEVNEVNKVVDEEKTFTIFNMEHSDNYTFAISETSVEIRDEEDQVITLVPSLVTKALEEDFALTIEECFEFEHIRAKVIHEDIILYTDYQLTIYDMQLEEWIYDYQHYKVFDYGDTNRFTSRKYNGFTFIYDSDKNAFDFEIKNEWTQIKGRYDGKIYVDYEYQVESNTEDSPVVYQNKPYISALFYDVEYDILDSFECMGALFFIEYKTNFLYKVQDNQVDLILKKPIRLYEEMEDGIYVSFEKEAGLYWFNGEDTELIVQEPVVELCSFKDQIALVDISDNVYIFKSDSLLPEKMFNIKDVFNTYCQEKPRLAIDDTRLYISLNFIKYADYSDIGGTRLEKEVTYIMDIESGSMLDDFYTRDIYVAHNGRVFYTALGDLLEYIPEEGVHLPIDMTGFNIDITSIGNQLLVYEGIDGPGSYNVFSMDRNWFEDKLPSSIGKDYVVLYTSNEFSSKLVIYDKLRKKYEIIAISENNIDYKISELGIEYKVGHSFYNESKNFWDVEFDQEWTLYTTDEGASIYDFNQDTMRQLEEFAWSVQEGYVYEDEILNLDEGRFIILARPIYSGEDYMSKGITAYVSLAHRKSYALISEEFRISQEAKIYHIEAAEDRQSFTIKYEEDGENYIAQFRVSVEDFKVYLVSNEKL